LTAQLNALGFDAKRSDFQRKIEEVQEILIVVQQTPSQHNSSLGSKIHFAAIPKMSYSEIELAKGGE
jgi:hypothetical protein